MKLIKGFIFFVNVIGWLIADIYLWTLSWCSGIGGSVTAIVAIVLFILKVVIEG